MNVTIHESILEIDPDRWDGLGADPLSSHAVLRILEQAGLSGIRTWYAVVTDEVGGETVAAAPLARVEVDGQRLTRGLFRWLIKAVRKLWPGFMRTSIMLCGTPLSVGNPPVRFGAGADRVQVLRELAGALSGLADEQRSPWRAFKEFPSPELPVAQQALEADLGWVVACSEPNSLLAIEWADFAGYLAALRSDYRYKIRRSEKTRKAAGAVVEVVPLAEGYSEEIHPLYEVVVDRAELELERLTPAFFQELGRTFGEAAVLIRFRRKERVVGWVAMLFDDDVGYDLFHGIDYAENDAWDLYFTQLSAVVQVAIERGARRLWLGQSSEVAKARFGGRPEPLWIGVRHRWRWVTRLLRWGRELLFPEETVPKRRVFRDPSPASGGTGPGSTTEELEAADQPVQQAGAQHVVEHVGGRSEQPAQHEED